MKPQPQPQTFLAEGGITITDKAIHSAVLVMKTFVFRIQVKPAKTHEHYEVIKLGYSVVWAMESDQVRAEAVARAYLESDHWEIVAVEEGRETTLEEWPNPSEQRERFETAQIYGVAASFPLRRSQLSRG